MFQASMMRDSLKQIPLHSCTGNARASKETRPWRRKEAERRDEAIAYPPDAVSVHEL